MCSIYYRYSQVYRGQKRVVLNYMGRTDVDATCEVSSRQPVSPSTNDKPNEDDEAHVYDEELTPVGSDNDSEAGNDDS